MAHSQHCWIVVHIRALVGQDDQRQRVPLGLRADLHCAGCMAALSDLTMEQLREEIGSGRVQGSSLAQWASITPLFSGGDP